MLLLDTIAEVKEGRRKRIWDRDRHQGSIRRKQFDCHERLFTNLIGILHLVVNQLGGLLWLLRRFLELVFISQPLSLFGGDGY